MHTFYAHPEWMLPISRIDGMRGEHHNAPAGVLASQNFK